MTEDVLTAEELGNLLVTIITGAAGGEEAKWRALVGSVEKLPIVYHPRSNWSVARNGNAAEQDTIARAVDIVREQHPFVR